MAETTIGNQHPSVDHDRGDPFLEADINKRVKKFRGELEWLESETPGIISRLEELKRCPTKDLTTAQVTTVFQRTLAFVKSFDRVRSVRQVSFGLAFVKSFDKFG